MASIASVYVPAFSGGELRSTLNAGLACSAQSILSNLKHLVSTCEEIELSRDEEVVSYHKIIHCDNISKFCTMLFLVCYNERCVPFYSLSVRILELLHTDCLPFNIFLSPLVSVM